MVAAPKRAQQSVRCYCMVWSVNHASTIAQFNILWRRAAKIALVRVAALKYRASVDLNATRLVSKGSEFPWLPRIGEKLKGGSENFVEWVAQVAIIVRFFFDDFLLFQFGDSFFFKAALVLGVFASIICWLAAKQAAAIGQHPLRPRQRR